MHDIALRGLIVSDINLDAFAQMLSNDTAYPHINFDVAPYNQVVQILLQESHPCWAHGTDLVVVWTRPESTIPSFDRRLKYEQVPAEEILEEVDKFGKILASMSHRSRFVFVPSWTLPPYTRGLGLLDMVSDVGVSHVLMRMNLRLAKTVKDIGNLFILDAAKWQQQAGPRAVNPKLWYLGKALFGDKVLSEALLDIKAGLQTLTGNTRKLIIVDLDNTLWGGIVGDDGWSNLEIGGHSYAGEAYADVQRLLKALTNRGVILGIVSKNEENVALEAIEKHPEMILKKNDFVAWRINWVDKAQNVAELAAELNLGLQSVVFLDDNPIERDRVRNALPEVFVPDLPDDPMLLASTIKQLRCFDSLTVSAEDSNRTTMYLADKEREKLKSSITSFDEWLNSLQITAHVEVLSDGNRERIAQLLNKTNQMNLATRRMTVQELSSWATRTENHLWSFRIADRFGEAGLAGIASMRVNNNAAHVVDFVLSCRVMGRTIEGAMVYFVCEQAKSLGLTQVFADFVPTDKNKPCFDWWQQSRFRYDDSQRRFSFTLDEAYPPPEHVQIIYDESALKKSSTRA